MKSGIELIEELLEQVKILNKRFEITEQNVKLLLGKANNPGLAAGDPGVQIMVNDAPVKIKSTVPEPDVSAVPIPIAVVPAQDSVPPNTSSARVTGKIKDKEGRVLSGINVRVYNIGDQMVKNTKTNRAGEWMCFLPAGKYYAKYRVEGQMTAHADFQVVEGQKIVRIGVREE